MTRILNIDLNPEYCFTFAHLFTHTHKCTTCETDSYVNNFALFQSVMMMINDFAMQNCILLPLTTVEYCLYDRIEQIVSF